MTSWCVLVGHSLPLKPSGAGAPGVSVVPVAGASVGGVLAAAGRRVGHAHTRFLGWVVGDGGREGRMTR